MDIEDQLNTIKQSLEWHRWQSGEIILEVIERPANLSSFEEYFSHLSLACNIKRLPSKEKFKEWTHDEAFKSIDYALQIHQNYTHLEFPFQDHERKELAFQFFSLFHNPVYFTIDTELQQKKAEFDSFTIRGGTLAADEKRIGIFWIYAVY